MEDSGGHAVSSSASVDRTSAGTRMTACTRQDYAGNDTSWEHDGLDHLTREFVDVSIDVEGEHDHMYMAEEEMSLEQIEHEARNAAATMIQSWWVFHHNRAVFARLKNALKQSSGAIAMEVLRRLCPAEASLLSDPTFEPVVRFRLGGTQFPPRVFFKVFLTQGSSAIVYLSGKKMIKPATEAAADSLEQMGKRKFIDLMVEDSWLQQQTAGLKDELDVTSMKEYMHYTSAVDNRPAWLGGRDNGWRPLEPTERHGVLMDFVEYAHGGVPSTRLLQKVPNLREPEPLAVLQEKLRIVQERANQASLRLNLKDKKSAKMEKNARKRHLDKMRELYGLKPAGSPDGGRSATPQVDLVPVDLGGRGSQMDIQYRSDSGRLLFSEDDEEDDDDKLDAMERSLFSWTQDLPIDDDSDDELRW